MVRVAALKCSITLQRPILRMQHGLLLATVEAQSQARPWEKHPAKKGKTLDCDWVAKSPKKRCKKKNKGGTKASKACACACA